MSARLRAAALWLMFAHYAFWVSLLVFGATLWKRMRILTGAGSAEDLGERLARRVPDGFPAGTGIVIHAASVGEVAEAETLIRSLHALKPDLRFLVTSSNRDGRSRAGRIADQTGIPVDISYLPWDRRRAIRRWLVRLSPLAFVTMESEIWPNAFRACEDLGIPVLIANGRIYPKDYGRYRLLSSFFRRVFACVAWIGVPYPAERERFSRIGADPSRIEIVGNLKLSPSYHEDSRHDERLSYLRRVARAHLTAGSTHPPEERWILEAFDAVRKRHPALDLIIAPRHVRRTDEIVRECRSRKLTTALWSDPASVLDRWDVLVVDEVGWLSSIYGCSVVAIVGGSLVPHGGHNVAEAALHGCAVITGPSVSNFSEMVEEFRRTEGLVIAEPDTLARELEALFGSEVTRVRVAAAARQVLERHADCPPRYAAAIVARLRVRD